MNKYIFRIFGISIPFIFTFLLYFFYIGNTSLQAQSGRGDTDSESVDRITLRLNLTGMGIGVEYMFYKNFTIYTEGGFSNTWSLNRENADIILQNSWKPYIRLQARCFYNASYREFLGKDTNKFASNFFGLSALMFAFPLPEEMNNYVKFGPVWGMQRNIGGSGFWGFHLGPGFFYYPTGFSGIDLNLWLGVGMAF